VTANANNNLFYSFGIGANIGKKKQVIVPAPPVPVVVDTDGDGIADPADKCPTVPGIAKYDGCPVPDTDKDGINDENDKCPTVPGLAKYQGCPIPDTDGDGINDEEDKCPTVAGLARYQGCPIPDTDGDGINDEEDKCISVAGLADNRGCPEMIFYYKRNDANLSAAEKADLDKLVTWMGNHPELNVSINGHTSTLGAADYNQKLSERRAQNTVKYLVSKGIDPKRLKAVGYGEQFPIGDNSKEEGRALSRRVVMRIAD
jgi:outer membrane protein OmpA-like peptidoglycan-associated protein